MVKTLHYKKPSNCDIRKKINKSFHTNANDLHKIIIKKSKNTFFV